MKKTQPQLTREQILRAKLHRNEAAKWERNSDGTIRIHSVRTRGRGGRLLSLVLIVPKVHTRNIDLDEIGSLVWEMCDGTKAVRQVRDAIVDRYKLHRREAEAALMEYLKQLMKRKLVGLELVGKTDTAGNRTARE